MVKTNQDIIGEQNIRNNNCLLVVIDEDKKIAWKSNHEKLLNTEFIGRGDRKNFSQVDIVSGVPRVIDKGMVRELISKIKNGKAAEPSV